MKRLLIALIVCVYIVTAVFSAVLPVTSTAVELDGTAPSETTAATETTESTENTEATEETSETTETTQTTEATDPVEETVPVEEDPAIQPMDLTWMKYTEYLAAEMAKDEADPARNVGREAVFYVGYWQTFICAANPLNPAAGQGFFSHTELEDEDGKSIQVKITDYVVDNDGSLWYKVEALEGETLPAVMDGKPYIIHLDKLQDVNKPTLLIVPQKAMFVGETVSILNLPVAATKSVELETANLPVFFDVIPAGGYWETRDQGAPIWHEGSWCELVDTTGWSDLLTEEYRYVTEDSVILIPPEVTLAYEALLKSETAEEYQEIWDSLPETVRDQFTDRHLEDLNNRQEEFITEFETTVDYGGTQLEVSVVGRIPEGVTLSVSPVSYETVVEEGFDVSSATDLITALDIKLLNPNGTEWQPEDGERIAVSIGVGALGIEDETVVRLHHKHGDEIYTFEVFIVLDGKVTVGVNGLSTFVVDTLGDYNTTGAVEFTAGTPITMTVGEEKIFYADITYTTTTGGRPGRPGQTQVNHIYPDNLGNWVGTWQVTDPTGAVYYEVFSPQAPNHNKGMWVAWIRVIALKPTDNVSLTFRYNEITYQGNNPNDWGTEKTETHPLTITAPKATSADGKALYLKDEVNTTGCITATLVDANGNEIPDGLDGVTFTWERKDGEDAMFINPRAYENDYRSVNIARDHAGMVEARKEGNEYKLVTYTLTATWADNSTKTATYTVRYQSEFLNASFEEPNLSSSANYSFYPNGWAGLRWKTTAPGTEGDLIRDMELGSSNGNTTDFGVPRAGGGDQFAELNSQEVGALYQDIITAPGETIEWDFVHAPRRTQSWSNNPNNKMCIIIGATEDAQELTEKEDLDDLVQKAKQKAIDLGISDEFLANEVSVVVQDKYGKSYMVWYHDAGTVPQNGNQNTYYPASKNYGWQLIAGKYEVPDDQYRTRLFFVSDTEGNGAPNFGNLIDTARAGQYKTYLIEYFEQIVVDGQATWVHRETVKTAKDDGAPTVKADESGEKLVYSSAPIENIDRFINNENDHLYMININGENYPYDIRYTGDESLYIEHYPGVKEYPIDLPEGQKQPNDYSQYDIVVHVFLRDTMVSVQKEIEFPVEMTTEQKLQLINSLPDDYQAKFKLYEQGKKDTVVAQGTAVTSAPNPDGSYTGFVGLDGNPLVGPVYVVEETETTELVGLELETVTFRTFLYSFGTGTELEQTGYGETQKNPLTDELLSVSFQFNEEEKQKVADVHVVNKYKEKKLTINYVAVGNGKVSEVSEDDYTKFGDFTETEAYYSGVVDGADVHPGYANALEGWYKDPECKNRVTSADGILESDGTFIPNVKLIKDVDDDYEVTFYAKFVSESIVINRTNAQPYENFVYHVVGNNGVDIYVTVACDENGNGSTRINEVPDGEYTVTEVKDWSWRYDQVSQTKSKDTSDDDGDVFNFELEFDFNGEQQRRNWLNGWDEIAKNVFKGGLS